MSNAYVPTLPAASSGAVPTRWHPSDDELISGTTVGQVSWQPRFDLISARGDVIGELHPDLRQSPSLTHDTTKAVMRQLTGVALPPGEWEQVDLMHNRVRPVLILGNGSEFSLGHYLFDDVTLTIANETRGSGKTLACTLSDQTMILDNEIPQSMGFPRAGYPYQQISDALRQAMGEYINYIYAYTIQAQGTTDPAHPIAYKAGDHRINVLRGLASVGNNIGPYFDNTGTMQVLPPRWVGQPYQPSFFYDDVDSYIAATATEHNNMLQAPNRFAVVDSGSNIAEVAGTFELPVDAPNSVVNRGFPIYKTLSVQNVPSVSDLQIGALIAAYYNPVFETATFNGPLDPRHDTYDIVQFDGRSWVEKAWTMALVPGGVMQHQLKRVWWALNPSAVSYLVFGP